MRFRQPERIAGVRWCRQHSLNRAVAVAMIDGPRVGLALLDELAADDRITDHHRLHAVRAHLLEMAGDHPAAREYYRRAADDTTSLTERGYLEPAPPSWRHVPPPADPFPATQSGLPPRRPEDSKLPENLIELSKRAGARRRRPGRPRFRYCTSITNVSHITRSAR
jgi:hypothetical protein